jgi:hypothetical protein
VRLVEGRERHARYPGQRFKVLAQSGHELADPGRQGTQSGGVKVRGENIIGHDCERTYPVCRPRPGTGDTKDAPHKTYSDVCVWTQEDP